MKIALIDDQAYELQSLKNAMLSSLVELGMDEANVECFSSGEEFLAGFQKGRYDVIVLDIYMGGLNGIEVARRIRKVDMEVSLAFCTSSNEFAGETYEVEAKYYLNKPISPEKVTAMLSRFQLGRAENSRAIRLPDGCRMPLRQILYTEYNNHSVSFHLRDGAPRSFYMAQSEAEALLLPHKGFCVVNKGCIVNLALVIAIEGNAFVMRNGQALPIARRRFKEIENAYMKYRFEQLDAEVSD